MSDEEFGDFEEADAYADEPADPEQVAIRMNELRAYLAEMAGEDLAAWDALTDEEKAIGIALGQSLIDVMTKDPANAPQGFHEALGYLQEQPEWDELSPEAQAVATALLDDLLAWLERQGALPTEATA
jgi:hypothetical protein